MPPLPRAAAPLLAAILAAAVALVPARGSPPAAVAGPAAFAPLPPPTDPFPLRRVFLPADRIDDAVGPAGGTLRRMPRDDFEARVRSAATAVAASSKPPRIVEARYRASLHDAALSGSAEWAVAFPGGPGVLSLDPLRAAVSRPRWGNRPAILFGKPGTGAAAAWADDPSDATLSLDWTARGAEEPGAERFDLGFPPAPVAVLDLDLPADRVPSADPPGVLVSGPYPAANNRHGWKVTFGGQPRVELTLRRPAGSGEPAPLVRAGRASRYSVGLGEAACEFAFDWEAVRGPVTELAVELAPGLRVTGVTTPRPTTWRADPPPNPGSPTVVHVGYRGPVSAGRVVVSAVASVPNGAENGWPLPLARVLGGLPGDDAAEVRVDPDLRFLGLDSGDFRVTDAGEDRSGYRVSLAGTLTADNRPDRKPPTLRVRPAEPMFTATEDVTWQPAPGRGTLTGRFRLKVVRGPLAAIPVRASSAFALRSVTLTPDDPGATWSQTGGGTWLVEPSRPVGTGQAVELRLDFVGPAGPPAPDPAAADWLPRAVPFPRLEPVGAGERDGTFTITVPPGFRGWPAPHAESPDPAAPAGGGTTFAYPYRGRGPEGVLHLGPRPPRVAASTDTTVSLDARGMTAASRVRVRCDAGEAGSVTLFLPGGPGTTWDVQADPGEGAVGPPLRADAAVAAGVAAGPGWGGLGAVGLAQELAGAAIRRVTFPRPLRGEVELTATARVAGAAAGLGPVAVPLPGVGGVDSTTFTVLLDPSAGGRFEPPTGPLAPGFPAVVRLRPRGTAPPTPDPKVRRWGYADLELTTRIDADGRAGCRFTGRVTAAGDADFRALLPGGATDAEVRFDGRTADPVPSAFEGRPRLRCRLPAVDADGVRFEVRYRLPAPPGPVGAFDSPVPDLPGVPPPAVRKWGFAPDWRPAPDLAARPDPTPDDRPTVTAVRTDALVGFGFSAAAVVAGLGVAVAARGRKLGLFLTGFLVLALAGTGWQLGGGWGLVTGPPALAGLLTLAAFRAARPPAPGPTGRSTITHAAGSWAEQLPESGRAVVAAPLAVLAVLALPPAAAQAPEPAVVYLTPAVGGSTLDALVSPKLLDRLDGLTRPAVPEAVVTAAEYDGSAAEDGTAVVDASFAVWCPPGVPPTLPLPLAGVRLVGVTVNGAAGFPEATGPDRYAVALPGPGTHTVRAKFEVPVAATGADREARFGGPDVPATRVRFAVPGSGRRPDVTTRRGAQKVEGPRADADHGGGKAVAVRWADEAGGTTPTVTVRTGCVWDVREADATATAVFLVRVDGGSVRRLAFEVPDGLAPGRVGVRQDPRPSGGGVGVRDWQVRPGKDGWQTLDVGLQAPLTGRAVVAVRLFPRAPHGGRPVLRFPRAVGGDGDGVFAVRFAGVTAAEVGRTGLIDYPADALLRELPGATELGLDKSPAALGFRRAGPAAELRPVLRPAFGEVSGAAEVTWTVGPRAEAEGAVRAAGKDGPVSVVEFELPGPVGVTEVRGPDVAAWARAGGTVQAWLRRPARDVSIRWSGTLTGFAPDAGSKAPVEVELPLPRGPGGTADPVAVRVRAGGGWALVPVQTRGLRPATGPAPDPGALRYAADPGAGWPKFTAVPPTPAGVRLLESVRPGSAGFAYRADFAVAPRAGRPTPFTVVLSGLPRSAAAQLTAPAGVEVAGPTATGDGPAWTVLVPAGLPPGPVRLAATAGLPPGPDVRLPAPVVWFGPTPVVPGRRAVAVGDTGLTPAGAAGWRPADAPERTRLAAEWPNLPPTGPVWLGGTGVERLTVVRPTGEVPPLPVPAATAVPPPVPAPVPDGERVREWLSLAGWVVGLGLVLRAAGWGGWRWWPERVAGVGLLGLTAAAPGSGFDTAFAVVAAVGGLLRTGWLARVVATKVMR